MTKFKRNLGFSVIKAANTLLCVILSAGGTTSFAEDEWLADEVLRQLFELQLVWATEMETTQKNDISLTIETKAHRVRVGESLKVSLTLHNNRDSGLTILQHGDPDRKPYVISIQDVAGIELVSLNTEPVPRSRGMKTRSVYLEPNGVYTTHDTLTVTDRWLGVGSTDAADSARYIVVTYSVARSDSGAASEITLLQAHSSGIEIFSKAAK